MADFINAADAREVIFTRNTTEAINLVAQAWGRANLKPGDIILVTEMEHHSNLVPWQLIAEQTGARIEGDPADRRPHPRHRRLSHACWPVSRSWSP